MNKVSAIICYALAGLLPGKAQPVWQAEPVNIEIIKKGDSEFPSGFSAFSLKNHFIWCGSAIQAEEDGKYYLFYSTRHKFNAVRQ